MAPSSAVEGVDLVTCGYSPQQSPSRFQSPCLTLVPRGIDREGKLGWSDKHGVREALTLL
ncbi:hypothetical protein GGTG_06518 [Gaeumannomyces tritici R3-111a-1]|uniref:Uncharacterized protein n=1 Tax=Gaeumannomyces tritici (strain R3-111a-1) TaxID=644352 RepID=J3NZ18_GAET3|nr:hypothetical protein GGTG_06518 [Gaeumannomyces tritici R3-111a-1]EJT76601.1 hypothetical protein GGTG_06518 [Gaeumannomyces tritici R3-111a-1]